MTVRVGQGQATRKVGTILTNAQKRGQTVRDLTIPPGKTSAHTRAREAKRSFHTTHPIIKLIAGSVRRVLCPLDRVVTYKNLIYLLHLQFCGLRWMN